MKFLHFCVLSAFSLLAALIASTPMKAYDYREYQDLIVPWRGLVYTADDVAALHQLLQNGERMPTSLARQFRRLAAEWMDRSEAEIEALIPRPDAHFAYGFAGDPKTDGPWPRIGRDGVCDLSRPGEVRSPITGDVYGIQKPGEAYYDPGDGWARPSDGKRFFFKGIWNSYVDYALHGAVETLSMAYLATGDPAVAQRALFILDRLAALRLARPDDRGVSEYPYPPRKGKGFLGAMGNHANSRMMRMAMSLDLLANSPAAQAPSVTRGLTVLENIQKNYFSLFEEWYYGQRELTNHGVILLANALAQGILFGDAQKLGMGLNGVSAFFDSTINRDGDYVEVSGNYGNLGRVYISAPTLMLQHYNPENYSNVKGLPQPANYPFELKFGDNPHWFRMAVDTLYQLPTLGRYPQYGDMDPDLRVLRGEDTNLAKMRGAYLRLLYHQTSRADWKRTIAQRYWELPASGRQSNLQFLLGFSQWTEPPKTDKPGVGASLLTEASTIMPGKGIVILKSGEGVNRRALFMRGGFNSYHGHDDQMALVPYGNEMMLAGEYGYNLAGTPDHYGWGMRSASHLMAVVDEDLPSSLSYKGNAKEQSAPAASLAAYLPHGPAQLVEMSNPHLWAKPLEDYRRTAWLVDVGAGQYYFADFFHIVGGQTHDYFWNAPFPKKRSKGDFSVTGISPRAGAGVWTLAALSGKNRNAVWNKPKQSWGERLDGMAGRVRSLPGEKALPTNNWNPDPGNGYGMIWDVRTEKTHSDWQAQWRLQDGTHDLRATLLNNDGMTAVTAKAPSLWTGKPFDLIVARRTRTDAARILKSRFINIVEVGRKDHWPTARRERLLLTGSSGQAVDAAGAKVILADGGNDLLVVSPVSQVLRGEGIDTDARNSFVRRDRNGDVTAISFQEGTRLAAGGWRIEADEAAFRAKVVSISADEHRSQLVIQPALPNGSALAGAALLIEGDPRAAVPRLHNEYYAIETVASAADGQGSQLEFTGQSLIAATWRGGQLNASGSRLSLEWRSEISGRSGSQAFQGNGVYSGQLAHGSPIGLIKVIDDRTVTLHPLQAVDRQKTQILRVLLASPGDRVSIPTTVTIAKDPAHTGGWRVRSTASLRLTLPKSSQTVDVPAGVTLLDADGSVRP